ncbi:MAG: L-fucose:H+ symporter permease [Cyclobacteriaceae bacterium]|nr:L-fucose:H+ symporter permease [Cyclobacteriaceae bacterium]
MLPPPSSKPGQPTSYRVPLILITSLFFFWGFVHNLDPILIPHLRKAFSLSYLQSALIDSAVFIAYFVMALPAGMLMKKYGYRMGIVTGLLLFGTGSLLFLVAADTREYIYFLGALFIIASGLTLLETAANPYVTILGPAETATQRLNFAQSFNGLAVVLAPLVGGQIILTGHEITEADRAFLSAAQIDSMLAAEAATVKGPYLVLGLIILAVAVVFWLIRLPEVSVETATLNDSPLRHPHLRWAVAAQFMYVGAQVCVSSFFINVAATNAGITEKEAAVYLGLGYGLAFMVGRFAGTFFMRHIYPERLLLIYSVINVFLSILCIYSEGMLIVYSLIGIAFFMSIMFPTIFSLGIRGLGHETKTASSLIIMAIVGGALLPPLMGYISDSTGDIRMGYYVPLASFIFIGWYAWKKCLPLKTETP